MPPAPGSFFLGAASPGLGETAPKNRETALDLVVPLVDVRLGDPRGCKLQPHTPGFTLLVSVLALQLLDTEKKVSTTSTEPHGLSILHVPGKHMFSILA